MKKFFYVAFMALTMGLFASCNSNGPAVGFKYADGENPDVDYVHHTVNGIEYDDTVEKCWVTNSAATYPQGGTLTITSYGWSTEFALVSGNERWVADYNHRGMPAGYSYQVTDIQDASTCFAKNGADNSDD